MSTWLYEVCVFCLVGLFACAAMCLYRIFNGPRAADRAIAFDTLGSASVCIICVLSMMWTSTYYFDAVWILCLVGFLGTASIARYLHKGKVF